MKENSLVDDTQPLVDKATSILYYRSALEYIRLRKLFGRNVPSIDEVLVEMKRRFPDRKTLERYTVLHQETEQSQTALRAGCVLPFSQS